jgi:phospholipase/carboxylesterase
MTNAPYVFADLPGDGPDARTLILLHGTGGDEHQFLELGADLLAGARRLAPRGDVSEAGALRYFKRLAEGRYDMADLARATDKLAAFIRTKALGTKVSGLGYSNGANILASVLFAAPDLFDKVVLLHPLIPFTPAPQPGLAGTQVLITAGQRDPVCPPSATEALAQWLRQQGAEVQIHWHPGGHEIDRSELRAARDFLA